MIPIPRLFAPTPILVLGFFFQAEDGIRDGHVTGVQTCALPILHKETLETYEVLLEYLDFTQAKARFAQKINAVLPHIKPQKKLNLIDAYHPILYLKDRKSVV